MTNPPIPSKYYDDKPTWKAFVNTSITVANAGYALNTSW